MNLKSQRRLAFTAMVNLNADGYQPDFKFWVYTVDTDGNNLKRIDQLSENEHPASNSGHPKWCSDGEHLDYTITRYLENEKRYIPTSYRVCLADCTELQLPIEAETQPSGINYFWNSPNGQHAYLLWGAGEEKSGFAIAKPDGSEENVYTEKLYDVDAVGWLPDSTAIVLQASGDPHATNAAPRDLWIFEMDSKEVVRLLEGSTFEPANAWSPDLQMLVTTGAAKTREYGDGFYLVNRKGTFCKHLVDHQDSSGEVRTSSPSWSPDGKYFALSSLLSDSTFDFSLLIFSREGELLSTFCWPELHFARIDEITWSPA